MPTLCQPENAFPQAAADWAQSPLLLTALSSAAANTQGQSRRGWVCGPGPRDEVGCPGHDRWPFSGPNVPILMVSPRGSEHPENSAREGARGPQPGLSGTAEGYQPAGGGCPDAPGCTAETGCLPSPKPALGPWPVFGVQELRTVCPRAASWQAGGGSPMKNVTRHGNSQAKKSSTIR